MAESPSRPRQVSAEMLLTDLDVANTFLDVAQTSAQEETVRRNHQNARHAYDTISGFLVTLPLDAQDRLRIEVKLARLRTRLLAVRYEV